MIGNTARVVVLAVVAAMLGAVIAAGTAFVSASVPPRSDVPTAGPPLPPRTGVWPVNFTFYGNAALGWGFSNATLANPGPNITVYYGDTVNLTLIGNDSPVAHTWFVDYDNSFAPNGDEPNSPSFNGVGDPAVLVWSFQALQPGNWTYRCGMHPNSMTGGIQVLQEPRPVNLTFYGDATLGWGFSNATIREPGPSLVVLWGTKVTLTLVGHDLADHTWFIDYNNDTGVSQGEPVSPKFNAPVGLVVIWPLIADQTGNWTYRCGIHLLTMTGTISIVGGPPAQLPRGALPLITGIMIGALAIVLVFAVVYHVRAVRAAKRMR